MNPVSGRLWVVRLGEHSSRQIASWSKSLDAFDRWTVGIQLVKSADSIVVNLMEGVGRKTAKDKTHFYQMARGSVEESIGWIYRAKERALISNLTLSIWMGLFLKLVNAIEELIKAELLRSKSQPK